MATNRIVFAASANEPDPSRVQELIASAQRCEQEGRPTEAIGLYHEARALLGPGDGLLASDLVRWTARAYGSAGDLDAGLDCADLALAIAEAHENERSMAQALNVMGILHQSRGGLDEAEQIYRRAEAHARAAGEVQLVAMVQLNIGTIANIRGEFQEALASYEACLVGFRATGSDAFISYVLNNLGLLYGDLGQKERAETALQEALATAARLGDRATQIMVLVNLADLFLSLRRIDEAEHSCREAERLVAESSDSELPGEWSKVMGVVQRERGRLQEAERCLREAFETAHSRDDLLLMAEVLKEQAGLYSEQERNQETLTCLNRSYQIFRQLRVRKQLADLERQLNELEETFLAIVRRWGESIEAADRYTQGHCVRVAEYACALAEESGMDAETLLWFRMGALLHDVGKIIVPPEVLNKPGGFTPEERMLMERHPDAGVELLEGIEFPWDIRPMVRFHHERWGGGGYPTGIAGEEIPLSARILAIADVFDALSTDRPYRKAMPVEQCLEIMTNPMKGHFEPELLDRFLELCRSGKVCPPDQQQGRGEAGEVAGRERLLLVRANSEGPLMDALRASTSLEFECQEERWPALSTMRGRAEYVAALVELPEEAPVSYLEQVQGLLRGLPVLAVLHQDNDRLALDLIQAGAQECLSPSSLYRDSLPLLIRRAIERKRVQSDFEQASMRDDLTGLYNRRGFLSQAGRRAGGLPADALRPVLMFADMDGLKSINDTLGHAEGDLALMEMAAVLRTSFRGLDLVARLGGDEFVILAFPGEFEIDGEQLIQRIEGEIAARNAASGRRWALAISMGVARWEEGEALDQVMLRADQEMYRRKSGRKAVLYAAGTSPRLSVA